MKKKSDLASRLRHVPSGELLELVGTHLRQFTLREVRQTLLNPYVTGEVIEELVLARHLMSGYDMRRAICRHRRTPEVVALRFVSGLFWRDLQEISLDLQLRPAVRRAAEKYLCERLPRLAVGEKINLARRALGEVLARLRRDPDLRVVSALLENPRLTEELLVPLAADSDSPRVLDLVARHERWGMRHDVRTALAKNPATPFRATFAILPLLSSEDLVEIVGNEVQSSVIRNRAAELLAERGQKGFDPDRPTPVHSLELD